MSEPFKSLSQSRKFWMAAITAVVTLVLFITGQIDAESLADALVILATVVIAGIAIEDGAGKFGYSLPTKPEPRPEQHTTIYQDRESA